MKASEIMTYIGRYREAETVAAMAVDDDMMAGPVAGEMLQVGWLTRQDPDGAAITPPEIKNRRDAVFAAILSKIPVGITRVLDIGCGDGHFATVLHAARPGVVYRGIDISMEGIATATDNLETTPGNLPANVELEVANYTEYLLATAVDWDFIISSRCLLRETLRPSDRQVLRLIDSKSPKGWFIYGDYGRMTRPDLQYVMQEALTNSDAATEHYFNGAQSFLDMSTCGVGHYPEHPAYIVRGATTAPAVDAKFYGRYDTMKNGIFEQERAKGTLHFNDAMTEYKSATFDAQGKFTGETTIAKAAAPAAADLAGQENRRQFLMNKQQIKG